MLKKIARLVLAVHLILLGLLFGSSPRPSSKHKPIVIKTMTLTPKPREQARAAPPKPSVPKTPSVSRPPPTPIAPKKKPAPPPPAPPKTVAPLKKSPSPTPKKVARPNSPQLAQLSKDLKESLRKMESPPPPKTPFIAPPTLHIDRMEENTSLDYAQTITHYLHQSLHLPDFGEVKIQLTLHQDGRIVKLVVLAAENERNQKYLEEKLPHLRLPPFVGPMTKQKECTLILTFCNEL